MPAPQSFLRDSFAAICVVGLAAAPAHVVAAPITLDTTDIEGGQPIRASDMRNRFQTIETESNAQDVRIGDLEALPLALSTPETMDVPTTGGDFLEVVTVAVTVTGGPVLLQLVPGPTDESYIACTGPVGCAGSVRFERATASAPTAWSTVAQMRVSNEATGAVVAVDEPAAGSYIYRLSGRTPSGSYVLNIQNVALLARQLAP